MTGIEGIELALAIASLILAVIVLAEARARSLIAWAMILCDIIWILRLVPAFHGT
jgi:hypothetical protein